MAPETTAIQAGIDAAWEWRSIAEVAACAAVKALVMAQIDGDLTAAEAQTDRLMREYGLRPPLQTDVS